MQEKEKHSIHYYLNNNSNKIAKPNSFADFLKTLHPINNSKLALQEDDIQEFEEGQPANTMDKIEAIEDYDKAELINNKFNKTPKNDRSSGKSPRHDTPEDLEEIQADESTSKKIRLAGKKIKESSAQQISQPAINFSHSLQPTLTKPSFIITIDSDDETPSPKSPQKLSPSTTSTSSSSSAKSLQQDNPDLSKLLQDLPIKFIGYKYNGPNTFVRIEYKDNSLFNNKEPIFIEKVDGFKNLIKATSYLFNPSLFKKEITAYSVNNNKHGSVILVDFLRKQQFFLEAAKMISEDNTNKKFAVKVLESYLEERRSIFSSKSLKDLGWDKEKIIQPSITNFLPKTNIAKSLTHITPGGQAALPGNSIHSATTSLHTNKRVLAANTSLPKRQAGQPKQTTIDKFFSKIVERSKPSNTR